jgi:hypothetical protein
VDPGILLLQIAFGLKDSLITAGFTIESILNLGPSELAAALGIEPYVAKIIYEEAKKIASQNKFLEDTTSTAV